MSDCATTIETLERRNVILRSVCNLFAPHVPFVAARIAFGLSGIYDDEEAREVVINMDGEPGKPKPQRTRLDGFAPKALPMPDAVVASDDADAATDTIPASLLPDAGPQSAIADGK